MRDWWHVILKRLDHSRGTVLGLTIASVLCGTLIGCEITTGSLISPGLRVSTQQLQDEIRALERELSNRRAELLNQIDHFNAQVQSFEETVKDRSDDITQQQQLREQIVAQVGGFAVDAANGSFNPVSAISTILSLISFATASGLMVDNLRKNRVINRLKIGNTTMPTTEVR